MSIQNTINAIVPVEIRCKCKCLLFSPDFQGGLQSRFDTQRFLIWEEQKATHMSANVSIILLLWICASSVILIAGIGIGLRRTDHLDEALSSALERFTNHCCSNRPLHLEDPPWPHRCSSSNFPSRDRPSAT